MSRTEVLERVKSVVAERLGVEVEQVKEEATFKDDLGADSLDVVELIMALEDEFDIEMTDEQAEKINTVQSVVDFVFSQL